MKIAIVAVLLAGAGAHTAVAQSCPNVDPAAGYPVVATAPGQPSPDATWLTAVASAAAYRWRVPSHRRNSYPGWDRVKHRVLPPEPRWADDWSPAGRDTARIEIVFHRGDDRGRGHVATASGDGDFDHSLKTIWDDPMPASPAFPPLPAGVAGDSVVVRLALGLAPDSGRPSGSIRFAAVQTPIALVPNTLRVSTPSGFHGRVPRVTVRYDVTEAGSVDPGSIEFLSNVDPDLEQAIRSGLRGAEFRAPTSNCRPVRQTIVQTFGG